ncbi:MAG: alpha/beta fold hydrolase [Acidimicrobiia bacterium]|nr:alpha/beta fold hydrolase [Acidimicrobiia bacterium]
MSKLRQVGQPVLVVLIVLSLLVAVGGGWWASNVLRDELLVPHAAPVVPDLDVLAVGSGRVVLSRTDLSETEGIWGLASPTAYGQVSTVASVTDDRVERILREFDGEFVAGDRVAMDAYAFAGDPLEAHGVAFEDVVVSGDVGFFPAWLVPGRSTTWVIFVHGKGVDERRQVLRSLPALRETGMPILAATYRNDDNAPRSESGFRSWGLSEWRDIEAAMDFGLLQGAEDFVLIGHSGGAEIISTLLHESEKVGLVRSVVFDSPVLSLETVADEIFERRNVPSVFRSFAKRLVSLRFNIDWARLDQVERAAEFDVPILIFHGTEDEIAPIEVSEAMAAAIPDLVTLEQTDTGHLYSWNRDPVRYEEVLLRFLAATTGDVP